MATAEVGRRSLPLQAQELRAELAAEQLTVESELCEPLAGQGLRCLACAHRCVLPPGAAGACGARRNDAGVLRAPFGYVARRYVRAVETNTIFHLLPGALSLTFGMYGCDLRCPYCHNHRVSQALREDGGPEHPTPISAEALVAEALAAGCRVLCAAYNEPMISVEWMRAVFRAARQRGLRTAVVSDGHSTPEALCYLREDVDVFRVDLKAGSEAAYRQLGGRMQPVLDTIALAKSLGLWVEVVTLVVPGLNQDAKTLQAIAGQLREIDRDMPWHLNGFVPRYRLRGAPAADPLLLMMAAGAAYVHGSRFVYVGNVPACTELAHTRCPECHHVLVQRHDYRTVATAIVEPSCPRCAAPLPGLWH